MTRVERALLLRRTEVGDSDLVLSLLTAGSGRVSAIARGARSSKRRFGGVLEPFHELKVTLESRPPRDLERLVDAQLALPRLNLVGQLDRLTSAGRALGWVRGVCPPNLPEPEVFDELNSFLDQLDLAPSSAQATEPSALLVRFGMNLLSALGWALQLHACIRCNKLCPETSPAWLDPRRGGLVCRSCGGGGQLASPALRRFLAGESQQPPEPTRTAELEQACLILEQALNSHAGTRLGT